MEAKHISKAGGKGDIKGCPIGLAYSARCRVDTKVEEREDYAVEASRLGGSGEGGVLKYQETRVSKARM